ncbi:glycoside hydrolase family 3 C-terminal domain-containing protein, partial [Streptomyces xantholiticus]|uniref:glycoside hydrolase family 3 C-terminal domain-containing protein n=1 Tax=Streptomyces xantholiticus TaxID=68285 RepID=UPI001E57E1EF
RRVHACSRHFRFAAPVHDQSCAGCRSPTNVKGVQALVRRQVHQVRAARLVPPRLIGDRLAGTDALVASWLPGSEGDGVAGVLYGERPFTGRLPVSRPRSEVQLPINVGDAASDP